MRFGPLRRPECPQMFPVPPRANSVNMQIADRRNPFMCLSVSVFFFLGARIRCSFIVVAQLKSIFTLSNFPKVSDSDIHFLLSPQRDG